MREWTDQEILELERLIRDKVERGQELTCGETVAWGRLKNGKELTQRFCEETDSLMGFDF
jgi:hypothetical protein